MIFMRWDVEFPRKVLWVSRHKPLNAELKFLEKKLGKYELEILNKPIPSAEWLLENKIKPEKIDIVIPVLPLSIVARLTELSRRHNFQIWWADMQLLHNDKSIVCPEFDPDRDAMVEGRDEKGNKIYRHYRFRTFKRIKKIKLELEDI